MLVPDLRPVEGPARARASRRPTPLPVAARLPLIGDQPGAARHRHRRRRDGRRRGSLLKRTTWGFRLRVVGGNPEAARRAGLRVGAAAARRHARRRRAGRPRRVRPARRRRVQAPARLPRSRYGYIGFLASWLARHQPLQVALAAVRPRGDRRRRRQPPDRLRPAGRLGEHPHGARAARRLRLDADEEGGARA